MCGEHSPCSGYTGFAPLTGVCAFPVYTAQAPGCSIWSRPCVECGSSFRVLHKSADSAAPACCVFPASAVQAARGLGALSPGAARIFPLRPQRAPVSGSLQTGTGGPVCSVGGGGFSGAEFAPFPSPLPPTSSGDGAALFWSFSVPLFCEPPAVCLAVYFSLLCHSLFIYFFLFNQHSLFNSILFC